MSNVRAIKSVWQLMAIGVRVKYNPFTIYFNFGYFKYILQIWQIYLSKWSEYLSHNCYIHNFLIL